ncbi:unnamed protein product [Blepharisma stoltei]|uniref:Uncharacterized protein n=1 Tax=Blepharisma stoltei TaxID=1481888 RepID=A0AAU9IZ80_9CILI|nr:unnamed protein product [Blepharisma stoltei]
MVDTPFTPFTPHTPRPALGDISNHKLLFSAYKTPLQLPLPESEEEIKGQIHLNLDEIEEITQESLGIQLESPIESPRISIIPDSIIEIDENDVFEDLDFEIVQNEIDRYLDTKPDLFPSIID